MTVKHRGQGHGPKREADNDEDSTLLMDATMKGDFPPLALPKREYMERAKTIWDKLGLPALRPQAPWFGYSLGDWSEDWDRNAQEAARGHGMDRGDSYRQRRRKGIAPNTPTRIIEETRDDD